ncbi:MAG: glycosyltransferase [candidate division Zixibacteria bacterium]|nr:glycosyltransferase [candidate division Zixibacteria bacterium]
MDVKQSAAIIRSVRWTSKNYVDESRLELMKENHSLRDHAFQEFENRYEACGQRILLHRPDNGAIKYLFDSWAETLNIMGLQTSLLNFDENSKETFQSFQPTVFITVGDPAYIEKLDLEFIANYQQQHELKIGHITNLQDSYQLCDFLITFHLNPAGDKRFDSLEKPLISVPFGINPNQHYMRPARQVWDFFFVGTNSQLKAEQGNKYLLPIVDSYRGILAGKGWNRGAGELSVSDSALLYNFAKVLPNYHIETQYETFDEVNERTCVIPACGGFELVDNPAAMKELFDVNEMAVANSPQEYREMFEHFLNNPSERLPYIQNGMRKVWKEYTLFHSLSKLVEFLKITKTGMQGTQKRVISVES